MYVRTHVREWIYRFLPESTDIRGTKYYTHIRYIYTYITHSEMSDLHNTRSHLNISSSWILTFRKTVSLYWTSTPSDGPLPYQRHKQSKKYHLILKLCNKYIANIVVNSKLRNWFNISIRILFNLHIFNTYYNHLWMPEMSLRVFVLIMQFYIKAAKNVHTCVWQCMGMN